MSENASFPVEDELPVDCWLEIFSYLSLDDMMQVKNVCRNLNQESQYWFEQVQTIVLQSRPARWELWEKNKKRRIYTETNHKKLISFLNSSGHHIKYYKVDLSEYDTRIDERSELIFRLVPQLCKNIVDIDISNVRFYPPSTFKTMATHWRNLEKLKIKFIPLKVGKDFYELLRNNKQLKTFGITFENAHTNPLDDEFFTYLPETIKNIQIVFKKRNDRRLNHFISASKKFTSLRVLNFRRLYLTDAVVLAITNIKSLIHLRVNRSFYESSKTIELISNIKGLKSLDLTMNRDLREDSLINIVESCTQLERLRLRDWFKLTDEGMAALAKLKGLKILDITAKFVSAQSIINLCSNLEVLFCYNSKMNHRDAITLFEKATNLRFVEFYDCENLTEDTMREAKRIANERRKNFFYLVGGNSYFCDDEEKNTPYFKYYRHDRHLPLNKFPHDLQLYIRNQYE